MFDVVTLVRWSGIVFLLAACASAPPGRAPPPPSHRRAVVRVRAWGRLTRPDGTEILCTSDGSGFLLDAAGHVVTSQHVVGLDGLRPGGLDVIIDAGTRRERSYAAAVAAFDPGGDLALLRLRHPPARLPALRLGRADDVRPGAPVTVQGYPEPGAWRAARGRILRVLPASATGVTKGRVETDAPVARGQSGGPLLADDGAVLGVIVETGYRERDGVRERFSRAVPVDYLRRRLAQWTPAAASN